MESHVQTLETYFYLLELKLKQIRKNKNMKSIRGKIETQEHSKA